MPELDSLRTLVDETDLGNHPNPDNALSAEEIAQIEANHDTPGE